MKISLIADPHLNKTIYKGVMDEEFTDIPFRNADLMRSFEFAINKNINEIHPDLIVILGDVYDTPHPLNPIRTFFNSQLRRLSEAHIPVIILVGNHDICSKHHALEPIAALGLKNVKVIATPTLTIFKDKILMLFPYSLEVEKKAITIRDQFHQFVETAHKQIATNSSYENKDLLFFGHFSVSGAIKNAYDDDDINDISGAKEGDSKKMVYHHSDHDISLTDLDTIGASHIFLGDFHRYQKLKCRTTAFYIGSPEKCNFSEKDDKKGFMVYDYVTGTCPTCSFVEYPNCRPMIELKGTYDEMLKDMESYPPSTKTLIKLYFVGNEKELLEYSIKQDDFKKKLQAKFKPLYIFPKQKLIDEEEQKEASLIESDILSKGHIDDNDVRQAAEEAIREKEKDPEEQAILIKMGNEVYEETKQGDV